MNKIKEFQELLKKKDIDAYIIPTSDYHMSEYTPAYFKAREYISGFTGDAGTLLVTKDDAKLWTDGRFFLQASIELEGSGITLMKMGEPGVPTLVEDLVNLFQNGGNLGFDGKCIETSTALKIKKAIPKVKIINTDLISKIYDKDRPSLPFSYLYLLKDAFSGKSFSSKISSVRNMLETAGCNALVLARLEDQAWLYNLRANDIECTPVFLSFTFITLDNIYLFVDNNKISDEVSKYLSDNKINVKNYNEIYSFLSEINDYKIMYDADTCNYNIYRALYKNNTLKNSLNPTTKLKAIKNDVEIRNNITAHVKDGVAMVKAMKYLYENADTLDEITYADYLEEKRKENQGFIELSFPTIAGFDAHGAIIHYTAVKGKEAKLNTTHPTFFLVDSGAHYCLGTTDITRTYALGDVSEKMKENYTLVLKCHIDLALAEFKAGTTGEQLDVIARQPLWSRGLDYRHGTGHGVGHILSVHEGPQSIRYHGNTYPLEPGMVTTDEPGLYIDGQYGIRIENELLCVEANASEYGKFYKFKTLTVCPYEPKAINKDMLTKPELDWLNNYHKSCYEKLSPYLNESEKEFLKNLTKEI